MKTKALLPLLTLAVVCGTGCRIPIGVDETWEVVGELEEEVDWSDKKVFFRAFRHSEITETYSATATGPGGTATAFGQTVGTMESVPTWMISLAQEHLPFGSVSPTSTGREPDYILQGHLLGPRGWSGKWWTWAQILVGWLPGWFLPTHTVYFEYDFELGLYDLDFNLIRSWRAHRVKNYQEWFWAALEGIERAQTYGREFLSDVLPEVGESLRGGAFEAPVQ